MGFIVIIYDFEAIAVLFLVFLGEVVILFFLTFGVCSFDDG